MKTFLKTLSVFVLIALVISGCTRDEPTVGEPRLFIPENQRSFTVEYGVATTLTIDVESNRQWIITPSVSVNVMGEDWAFVTPELLQGENNGQITVTLLSNPGIQPRGLNLTIATAGRISQKITIIQHGTEGPPLPTTLIYAEDFGTGLPTTLPQGESWPWVTEWQGWNTTGTSAATIWYDGTGTSVRGNSMSSGYQGASGGNNVMFASNGTGVFFVNGINPGDYQNFFLSFGTNQMSDTVSVYFSVDNRSTWTQIPFNKTTTTWGLVETVFSIPQVVDSFSLRFTAGNTQFGARIDDVELRGTTQIIEPPTTLTINPTSLSFVASGEQKTFDISSNTNWTVSSNASWATVNTTSGNGDETITVTTEVNPDNDRQAIIAVITGDGSITRTLNISQAGIPVPNLFEDFETMSGGGEITNFMGHLRTFATGEWFLRGATSPSTGDISRIDGRAVRLRGNMDADTARPEQNQVAGNYVEMRFNKPNGIGTVEFKYASSTTHSNGIIRLYVSSDNGSTWTKYGNDVTVPSWTNAGEQWRTASIQVNRTGNNRIRILKPQQLGSTSVIIDDIFITDFIEP